MDNTPEMTPEELTQREQAVALRERRLKARELLSEHHLPPQVGEALNYDSDEALEQSIALAKAVMAATRNTQAPRAPRPGPGHAQHDLCPARGAVPGPSTHEIKEENTCLSHSRNT